MPAPVHVIRVIPLDLLDDVQTVTGMTATTPVFTIADLDRPRVISHRIGSGPVNPTQRAMLDAARDGNGNIIATEIDPSFVGVGFVDWPKDQASPEAALLAGLGLTRDANFEES